ncbi:hypothetical protein D5I55_12475 [Chakrabartia godavariana]|nr:hypothetical protein D5I55_12475 [Chakrabartia godavariana]
MSLDIGRLFIGTLDYTLPMAALDDARFERILRGFASHYVVNPHSHTSFAFERGEGFDTFEKWDAFAYVDGGDVTRLRGQREVEAEPGANIAILPPPWTALRFTLNIRVVLIFWALALIIARSFTGGDWLFWLIGFLTLYGAHVALIRRSLKKKLARWLARESWN